MANNVVSASDGQFPNFIYPVEREPKVFLEYWIMLHMFDIKEKMCCFFEWKGRFN